MAGLSICLVNADYKILSFGWQLVGQKPLAYEWMLELECVD
jgi:hypothetical protein